MPTFSFISKTKSQLRTSLSVSYVIFKMGRINKDIMSVKL